MNHQVLKSGKTIGNIDHHTIPTGLLKARRRFLDDEYLEDIECASDSKYFFFKGKCCHSFRKNDPPHNLKTPCASCQEKWRVLCVRVWQEKEDSVTMCWH